MHYPSYFLVEKYNFHEKGEKNLGISVNFLTIVKFRW